MSEKSAKMLVLLTGAFLFSAIFIKRPPNTYRYTWGAGIITLGLSVVADFAPEVAGPFALLVLVAVYAKNRGVLGSVLPSGPIIPSTPAQPASPPSSGGTKA